MPMLDKLRQYIVDKYSLKQVLIVSSQDRTALDSIFAAQIQEMQQQKENMRSAAIDASMYHFFYYDYFSLFVILSESSGKTYDNLRMYHTIEILLYKFYLFAYKQKAAMVSRKIEEQKLQSEDTLQRYNELHRALEEKESVISGLQQEYTRIQQEKQHFIEQNELLRVEKLKSESIISENAAHISRLEKECRRLLDEQQSAAEYTKQLQIQIEENNRKLHAHYQEHEKLMHHIGRLQAGIQEKDALISDLQNSNNEYREQQKKQEAEKVLLHGRLQEKEDELLSVRQKMEEQVKLLELISSGRKKLIKIFDTLNDPILTLKDDYSVESINNAGASLISENPAEVVKKNLKCYEILGKKQPCKFCFLNIVKRDMTMISQTIVTDIAGEQRYFILTMLPVIKDGVLEVVIEYFKDITDTMLALEEKSSLESKLKEEIDEKERMKVSVDWTQVDKVKKLVSMLSVLKEDIKFKNAKIVRLNSTVTNLKKNEQMSKQHIKYSYEINKVINLFNNLIVGKKIMLNSVQQKNLDDAISLIKEYAFFLQGDVTSLETENAMLKKQVDQYEAILEKLDPEALVEMTHKKEQAPVENAVPDEAEKNQPIPDGEE